MPGRVELTSDVAIDLRRARVAARRNGVVASRCRAGSCRAGREVRDQSRSARHLRT